MSANRVEGPLPPRLILLAPFRRDLPVVHHRRFEEGAFCQGNPNMEGLHFMTQGFGEPFQGKFAGRVESTNLVAQIRQ